MRIECHEIQWTFSGVETEGLQASSSFLLKTVQNDFNKLWWAFIEL